MSIRASRAGTPSNGDLTGSARKRPSSRTIAPALLAIAFACSPFGLALARAESLADALALAYQTNPTLQSQRAQVRAVDETYVQAKAGAGPSAQAQVTGAYNRTNLPGASPLQPPGQIGTNTAEGQVSISQPIYSGGRTAAAVDIAQARIAAGRAQLEATEAAVMLAVVTAYSDVLRDTQALDVRRQHLEMLAHQLDVAKARQSAGEATLTDVAQAEAQLAGVRALVSDAQNQLQISRAAYATVVGQNPGELTPEPDLPGIPASVDDAFRLAEAQSPDLALAQQNEAISHAQVIAARVAYRPSISVSANAGYAATSEPFFGRSNDWDVSALATLTAPLFTNGAAASGVRQALEQNTSDRIAVEGARRAVVQSVADAWNQMITARADVGFQQEQVRAASAAFKGMQIEYDAGERSTLDVLLAEETLRNAELALLAAEHDQYVAVAQVLRFVGRLQGPDLIASLPPYDPAKHLRHVRHAGMVPWTDAIVGVDQIALPGARTHAIPQPQRAVNPTLKPPSTPVPPDAPIATAIPVAK